MTVAADDKDYLPSTYTNADLAGADDDVERCITESVLESHKLEKNRLIESHSQESRKASLLQ